MFDPLQPAPDDERCDYQPVSARCVLPRSHPGWGHVRVLANDAEDPSDE